MDSFHKFRLNIKIIEKKTSASYIITYQLRRLVVEKIKNVKSFRCFAAIICQEPERKFKMSLRAWRLFCWECRCCYPRGWQLWQFLVMSHTAYTQGHRWAWLGTLFIVDLLLVRMVIPGLWLAVTVGRCYLVSKIMGLAGFKQLPGEESRPWSWSRVKTWTQRQRQNTNQSQDNESCVAIVRPP